MSCDELWWVVMRFRQFADETGKCLAKWRCNNMTSSLWLHRSVSLTSVRLFQYFCGARSDWHEVTEAVTARQCTWRRGGVPLSSGSTSTYPIPCISREKHVEMIRNASLIKPWLDKESNEGNATCCILSGDWSISSRFSKHMVAQKHLMRWVKQSDALTPVSVQALFS